MSCKVTTTYIFLRLLVNWVDLTFNSVLLLTFHNFRRFTVSLFLGTWLCCPASETNSSVVGLAWVAAFENKERLVEHQPQHGISREVSFQNFIKNKNHLDFCEGDD